MFRCFVWRRYLACAYLLLPVTSGCGAAGGQTGDGSPAQPEESSTPAPDLVTQPGESTCNQERRLVTDPGARAELGFSAQEAARTFERHELTRLSWTQGHPLTPSFEPAVSELTFTLTADVGAAMFVESVLMGVGTGECASYLELPVSIELRTAGGALDEQLTAKLRVESLSAAASVFTWEAERVTGDWGDTLRNAEVNALQVSVVMTSEGSTGELLVHSRSAESQAGPNQVGPWSAARWSNEW